jgi:nitrite reductase/ring-hydroxylating ferredoxin subunit
MAGFVKVARSAEIKDGSGRVVEVGARKIAVFNAGGNFYAIDNTCTHRGGPLGEGEVHGTHVVCPWHGWEFDFATGCNVDDLTVRLACYAVRVENGDVLLEV